jgi:hypothetical protein
LEGVPVFLVKRDLLCYRVFFCLREGRRVQFVAQAAEKGGHPPDFFVHTNFLPDLFHVFIYSFIALLSSDTNSRRIRFLVISANHLSTKLSQEE